MTNYIRDSFGVRQLRKFAVAMLACLMVLLLATQASASLDQFAGRWVNADSATRGVTTLEITVSDSDATVQAWGSCVPTDCDWGAVQAVAYAPDVSSDIASTALALTAGFDPGFAETLMVIRPDGDQLSVQTFTRFKDSSGRSNYAAEYSFVKEAGVVPEGQTPEGGLPPEGQTPEGGLPEVALPAPRLISPVDGVVFYHYPRTTTLAWEPVEGADIYGVEIDCFHCCQSGQWCTDVGDTYRVVDLLNTTSYTFDFVGAQPGRWRAWAISPSGEIGEKSAWWGFEYTQ